MTDERDIAQDKKDGHEKRNRGDGPGGNAAVQPQPGKKPPLIQAGNEPSNSRAREVYKEGEAPRDHSHETYDNPDEGAKPKDRDSAV